MKLIKTENAVGNILCHDITRIVIDEAKGVIFSKGHVIREEDIPVLLSIGKENLYVWEDKEGMIHENEAAKILYNLFKGVNMHPSLVKEGKIEFIADCDGVLKVDSVKMDNINALGEIIVASRHGNFQIKKGDAIAATRVIPLRIEESKLELAREIAEERPIFEINKYVHKKIGIVTTGSEIFYGRINDTFTPVIREKLKEYDIEITDHCVTNDNVEMIEESIQKLLKEKTDMIICTGGMSVDPDDRTPYAIKKVGAEIVAYGAPVLPGAMFLLAYYNGDVPIIGLPGCVMYNKKTIFDLVLPRLMTNERINKSDLTKLGQGGLCLHCEKCVFPNCGFGK